MFSKNPWLTDVAMPKISFLRSVLNALKFQDTSPFIAVVPKAAPRSGIVPRKPNSDVCATTWCRLGGSPARFVGSRHGVNGLEHSISLAVGVRVFCEKPP